MQLHFFSTFQRCRNINDIPEGLFDACTKATNFYVTFLACTSVASIPVSLFDHNLEVTNFENTFAGCISATGVTPNTNGIELWMRSDPQYPQYPNEINVQSCFAGCTTLTNYDDIPDEAK
ncbi:MAG: hypothetical protein LUD74_06970 [Tannerellaceae bacterium]|nr:hypothetical protein [Tannerellaceae bacterium]